jgi:putative membrane protein
MIEQDVFPMDDFGSNFGGMLFALLVYSIVAMVMIWVPYALINLLRQRKQSSAREIVDERYARGELSEQEYQRIRDNLNN